MQVVLTFSNLTVLKEIGSPDVYIKDWVNFRGVKLMCEKKEEGWRRRGGRLMCEKEGRGKAKRSSLGGHQSIAEAYVYLW